MAAHASGFILKDASPDQLANAIRGVHAGRRVIDPQLAIAAWDGAENPLTEREIQVLRLAEKGAEPTEIAAILFLSSGTVRNYLTTTVAKLNARNRIDAIRIAQEAGWL
jgi:two-component system response regulator DesR